MKRRLHSRHTPEGRKPPPLRLVKVVEPTESGVVISYRRLPRRQQ